MPSVPFNEVHPVLAALTRGVVGPRYHSELPRRMYDMLGLISDPDQADQLLKTLRMSATRPGALLLTGRATPVSWMTETETEALIKRWKFGRVPQLRQMAAIVITLAMNALYGYETKEWAKFGYEGPLGPPPENVPKTLSATVIDSDERIDCDVVIVGSGAGGGVAAAVLAEAGLDVVVLEKGRHFNESDFHHEEARSMQEMYLYGGALMSRNLTCRIISGSGLGGGTLVNYSTAWKTPEPRLREWADVSGIDAFVNGEIQDSLDAVAERIGINRDETKPARRDALLEEGCTKLGWHVDVFPKATKGCLQDASCSYCGFGCRVNAKQGTLKTFLPDAAGNGARLFVEVDVEKVTIEDGRATGVKATSNGHTLTVTARAVVSACGTIETPALLLRSGLGGRVGHDLRLHAGLPAIGFFDEDVRVWEGTTQSRYSFEFTHWGGGYGPTLETIPSHPGAGSIGLLPWTSEAGHRSLMDRYNRLSFVGALGRDTTSGRIRINKHGKPDVEFNVNEGDGQRQVEGIIAAAKVLEAAGANEILSPHPVPLTYRPGPGAHERWAEEFRRIGFKKDQTFFSFHQMGSCRMGVDPTRSAIDANNETHEVKGLYVLDGSTFPTPSGVNPMVSIYGIAHRGAKKLAHRLS